MPRKPLTPDEVAEFLQVSRFTVYELVKRGELPAFRVGRQVRIDPDALEAYIKKGWSRGSSGAPAGYPHVAESIPDRPAPVSWRPAQASEGYVPAPEGPVPSHEETAPAPEGPATQPGSGLKLAGSHDLALELLGSRLARRENESVGLTPRFVGSLEGLLALHRGQAAVAGAHLWDRESGSYNLPFIRRIFPGRRLLVVHLVRRLQGFLVAPGNPLDIHSWHDLTRPEVRFVNRQAGSGTRLLLDDQLGARGISPEEVRGYDRESATHAEVAGAVQRGEADVALGIYAAARAGELGFVPLVQERYDLVMPYHVYDAPDMRPLLELLDDRAFRQEVESLGGYDASDMGRVWS